MGHPCMYVTGCFSLATFRILTLSVVFDFFFFVTFVVYGSSWARYQIRSAAVNYAMDMETLDLYPLHYNVTPATSETEAVAEGPTTRHCLLPPNFLGTPTDHHCHFGGLQEGKIHHPTCPGNAHALITISPWVAATAKGLVTRRNLDVPPIAPNFLEAPCTCIYQFITSYCVTSTKYIHIHLTCF